MGNKIGAQVKNFKSKLKKLGLTDCMIDKTISEAKSVFVDSKVIIPRLPRYVSKTISTRVLEGPVVVLYKNCWKVYSLQGFISLQKQGPLMTSKRIENTTSEKIND